MPLNTKRWFPFCSFNMRPEKCIASNQRSTTQKDAFSISRIDNGHPKRIIRYTIPERGKATDQKYFILHVWICWCCVYMFTFWQTRPRVPLWPLPSPRQPSKNENVLTVVSTVCTVENVFQTTNRQSHGERTEHNTNTDRALSTFHRLRVERPHVSNLYATLKDLSYQTTGKVEEIIRWEIISLPIDFCVADALIGIIFLGSQVFSFLLPITHRPSCLTRFGSVLRMCRILQCNVVRVRQMGLYAACPLVAFAYRLYGYVLQARTTKPVNGFLSRMLRAVLKWNKPVWCLNSFYLLLCYTHIGPSNSSFVYFLFSSFSCTVAGDFLIIIFFLFLTFRVIICYGTLICLDLLTAHNIALSGYTVRHFRRYQQQFFNSPH